MRNSKTLLCGLIVLLTHGLSGAAFSPTSTRPVPCCPIKSTGTNDDDECSQASVTVKSFSCLLKDKIIPTKHSRGPYRRLHKQTLHSDYEFDYQTNILVLNKPNDQNTTSSHRVILLIHPIGVGIGRWYYDRLLAEMKNRETSFTQPTTVIALDLLACASASEPVIDTKQQKLLPTDKLPLLTVKDWSNQVIQLMEQYEASTTDSVDWVLLSNGGCVPIALDAAAQVPSKVSHVILSAPPRLVGLLRESPSPTKLHKAYRRLSGIAGRVFWWYALRKNGTFIQTFSERNLAANASTLGDSWTPTCVATCRAYPKSRYSTFAFLAGSLQWDCRNTLKTLQTIPMPIDVIQGGDRRSNPAKSWLWDKQRQRQRPVPAVQSISEYLQENGNGGRERVVGGRRCPAHEDPVGFAVALLELLEASNDMTSPTRITWRDFFEQHRKE